ncbi:NAD(P)-dependent dehydrogenase, short-chain alcohol dehydrogenase family [Pedobacter sp. ok626]|uniref:SDR family NAD(P)-dependent oxidoreductase n=1 Tax=Pedobacter sp. ok626 TaxID=1761882 RepID=UPI000880D74C|nr:SDR family oxidoreductase [Pedobacter sp. ok626]SDJ46622.1 NAD(P)-dependent dehydrogenase, short-chain alcohol dehydrogenase family [Pedobacter sp. ok626]
MEIKNKIALITGGSRGLGKNAALKIAAKGINIILTYQSQKEEAENTVEEIKKLGVNAAALQLNVADTKSFDSFFTEIESVLQSVFKTDKFDFLINNAGIGVHASFAETTEDQFDNLVDIHFKGAFFLTQKALPLLNDGSGIINVSSGLARFATPGYAAYAAMKGAMETLTRYQAKELGPRGIRSNIIAPGAIETDFGNGLVRDNEQLNTAIASQTALGRVGLPDDIGGVVAFLCTEDARWITAQRIEISGGMFL